MCIIGWLSFRDKKQKKTQVIYLNLPMIHKEEYVATQLKSEEKKKKPSKPISYDEPRRTISLR